MIKVIILFLRKVAASIRAKLPSEKRRRLDELARSNERSIKIKAILKSLFPNGATEILGGPFEGMRYIPEASGSQLLPKILGSYEEPLHEWIGSILNNYEYTTIIDVGCAEGYYAVGLSRAKSRPRVIGFDIDEVALAHAKKLAELNASDRSIVFQKKFDNTSLKKILNSDRDGKFLIFMDVEGAEASLLDPNSFPDILRCDILAELHDCFYPQTTDLIIGYLSGTHRIRINLDYEWRNANYCPPDKSLSDQDYLFAIDEVRPNGMRWIYAEKK